MDMSGAGLPILTYHAIDATGSVISTDPSWFAETLDALVGAGFRAWDLGEWIARGRPEVDRGFALTFDDGLRSILDVADVLARHRVPATVFLVTDRMGKDSDWPGQPRAISRAPLLSWSDLDALAAAGFRFAAHGRTHRRLDRCDDITLERELRGSRDAIEQRLGRPCRLLAYPYGLASARVRRAARRHFDAAFGTRLDVATAADDPYHLSRVETHYLRSRRVLDRFLSGRARPWLRRRRLLRAVRGNWLLTGACVPGKRQGAMPTSAWACRRRPGGHAHVCVGMAPPHLAHAVWVPRVVFNPCASTIAARTGSEDGTRGTQRTPNPTC
jgi:peptidoglycan/xylan/chitin deacetylase (PgdA/CDA1 family)